MTRVLSAIYCLSAIASIVSYSPSALALEATEISAIAKEFTVKIDGEGTGTGTIIDNDDGSYSVLTCWHVVDTEGNYQVTTADGTEHQITKIENLPDVDLAVITFRSSNEYPSAKFGNSDQAVSGSEAYVAAYPAPTADFPKRLYSFKRAPIESRSDNAEDGYELLHGTLLASGSSGGGLFDSEARLIGINGRVIPFDPNTNANTGIAIPAKIYLAEEDNLEVSYFDRSYTEAYLSRGKSYFARKEYKNAIAKYNEAINLDPNYAEAYSSRGDYYYIFRAYEEAIADYDEAIRLDPENASAYFSRGQSYGKLQKYEEAIANYDEAIRLNPKYAEAHHYRGLSHSKRGYNENAIADYDQAISIKPEYAEAYYGRGFSYSKLGDYEQALTNFDKAISLNPEYTLAYYNRGLSYFRLENYQQAIASFDQTVSLDSNYADAYFNCGLSHKMAGNDNYALKHFEQAAELYRRKGNTDWYQKALAQVEKLRY